MKLNFSKENGVWVAEVGVTADFNLHLERVDDGLIKVMQRTPTEGEYVDTNLNEAGDPSYKNFDCDFTAFVYPKCIKVVSGTEVTDATITTSGEVTNLRVSTFVLKLNSKTLEYQFELGMTFEDWVNSDYNTVPYRKYNASELIADVDGGITSAGFSFGLYSEGTNGTVWHNLSDVIEPITYNASVTA